MSHKKRAPFALKSMGAAGLAAATIVSGLSFGAAPATAAPDSRASSTQANEVTGLRGKFVISYVNQGNWYTGYKAPKAAGSVVPAVYVSSASSARAAAGTWIMPNTDASGSIRADGTDLCMTATSGIQVTSERCDGRKAQQFSWVAGGAGVGSKTLVSNFKASNNYLSNWGANLTPGATIQAVLGRNASFTTITSNLSPVVLAKPLTASVSNTNNISKSAQISGTATPGAKVSIGAQEVKADATSGAWSITVSDLQGGKNDLVVVQTVYGVEHDRVTVSPEIVEGGTLVGVDQGPIELERGDSTAVPFVVENRESRTDTKGTVVLTAPDGATFSEQDTVQGSWRRVGNTAWNASTSIPLSNGRLSNDNTTLTFDVDWASERPTNQQYRFMIDVTAAADAPETPSAMEFDFSGTSSTSDFRAQGSTSTTTGTGTSIVDLTAEVASVDSEARSAVVTGTATPGADISIGDETAKADAITGAWSITVDDLEVGDNALVVVQKINDREIDRKTVTATVEDRTELAPITLSGPTSVTPGRSNTFTGTAEPGATFRVLNVSGTQIVPGIHEVDAQGNWTFDRVVSNGASNFRFVIEQTKNGQVAKSELFTVNASALAPVTVTTPERVTPGRSNTFTGTGEPGATFRVLNISGTQIVPGTHDVDAQGNWTFDRVVSNGASNFRFVIEQTKNGQVEKSELFTINAAALAPVTVTTPERVTPGRSNTFTGTGEPGATFRVLNISGTQIVPGTHDVDAQGNWTFDRVVSNGASNFRFVIEQTKNGQVEKSELFTINAADFAPVTVANRSVTPGAVNTFTGTGEPGASYRVLNITGTQIVPGTFEVDAEGNWTFDRAVSRGATEFRFALEQTKNGKVELSELFTLPADTK
ncbi:hypothetical protein [Curtobacterium sp. MCLR17_058]|uniref:RICIN domain-containing protein n=1 Tax=Curtobacterium sp. MCLR17_058 TaxID=2175635 RepID=UPI0011B7C392|nr:hypothetical protein [Curtobacterium sp. MCLR17_058]WIB43195.1 hypothetical protein DEJ11_02455 [Curtobacterium sp. MCLR17_058]